MYVFRFGKFFLPNNFYYVKLRQMKASYLIPIGAGAIALYFLSKAQAGKNIIADLDDISTGGTIAKPELFLNFRIYNGSNTGVTVKSILGEVFAGKDKIATVSNFENFLIARNSEQVYKVRVRPQSIAVITTLFKFLAFGQKISITFKGTVNTTGVILPIEKTVVI